jgi:hypothetical protein
MRCRVFEYELVVRHSAPSRNVGWGPRIESDNFEYIARRGAKPVAQLEHKIAATEIACVPFIIEIHIFTLRVEPSVSAGSFASIGRKARLNDAVFCQALRLLLATSHCEYRLAAAPQKRTDV